MESDKERIDQVTQQIVRLYHDNIGVEEAIDLMGDQNISAELVYGIYTQLFKDAEKSMTERFHYCNVEVKRDPYSYYVNYWTSRYILGYERISHPPFYDITIFDLFNDKSIDITIATSANQFIIYPLKDGFGLLKEYEGGNNCISLIFLDIRERSLQKLHTVEYHTKTIFVNKADLTTFILKNNESIRICKVVEKTIIVGDVVEINFDPKCFYDKCVYGLGWNDETGTPQIYSYNVEEMTENHFDLEEPAGYIINWNGIECVHDNLFVGLKCKNGANFIGCLNVQTHQWNILDFFSKLPIRCINRSEEGSLIVYTNSINFEKYHLYKIPFGKPDSLENTAWLSLVKAMKKRDTIEDPYETARKYLPPNSSITCPFEK